MAGGGPGGPPDDARRAAGGGFAASWKGGGGPSSASGHALFWSDVSVPGRPRVLMLDAAGRWGEQAEAFRRIAASLVRRGIPVVGGGPKTVEVAGLGGSNAAFASMDRFLSSGGYNCVFLSALGYEWGTRQAARDDRSPSADECLAALEIRAGQLGSSGEPMLFALCTWDTSGPDLADSVLRRPNAFCTMAVAQQEPMSVRGASLFFMKFFAELDLHSEATGSITGKMVWFGHSKAREIMRRRHYEGRVGLRC